MLIPFNAGNTVWNQRGFLEDLTRTRASFHRNVNNAVVSFVAAPSHSGLEGGTATAAPAVVATLSYRSGSNAWQAWGGGK
jgi:hypothetical protein